MDQDALVRFITQLALAKTPQLVGGIPLSLTALKRTPLAPPSTPTDFLETATVRVFLRANVGTGHSTPGLFTFLGDVDVDVNYIWEM